MDPNQHPQYPRRQSEQQPGEQQVPPPSSQPPSTPQPNGNGWNASPPPPAAHHFVSPTAVQPAWNAQPSQPMVQSSQHANHQAHHQVQGQPIQPNLHTPHAMPVDAQPPAAVIPAQAPAEAGADPLRPMPVVRVLSPIGVEYVFLTVTLFIGAFGLASALLAMVNGKFDFEVLAFPAATLLVCLPIFAYLFLRLKKLELLQPGLKLDPSKRRSTQFTQIVSFAVCLFTLIGLVFAIFGKLGGISSISIFKAFLDALSILLVAGGILAYYWRDEHKGR